MTIREDCAKIAEAERAYLKRLKRKRQMRGDFFGATRASVGMTIAARIANAIRRDAPRKD